MSELTQLNLDGNATQFKTGVDIGRTARNAASVAFNAGSKVSFAVAPYALLAAAAVSGQGVAEAQTRGGTENQSSCAISEDQRTTILDQMNAKMAAEDKRHGEAVKKFMEEARKYVNKNDNVALAAINNAANVGAIIAQKGRGGGWTTVANTSYNETREQIQRNYPQLLNLFDGLGATHGRILDNIMRMDPDGCVEREKAARSDALQQEGSQAQLEISKQNAKTLALLNVGLEKAIASGDAKAIETFTNSIAKLSGVAQEQAAGVGGQAAGGKAPAVSGLTGDCRRDLDIAYSQLSAGKNVRDANVEAGVLNSVIKALGEVDGKACAVETHGRYKGGAPNANGNSFTDAGNLTLKPSGGGRGR